MRTLLVSFLFDLVTVGGRHVSPKLIYVYVLAVLARATVEREAASQRSSVHSQCKYRVDGLRVIYHFSTPWSFRSASGLAMRS